MRSLIVLSLLLGSFASAHAGEVKKVSNKEWAKSGYDPAAQKAFVKDAKTALAKKGIDATFFPKEKSLGEKPYLGTIQVQVRGADNVKKAFKVLAPKTTHAVAWRSGKRNLPNVMVHMNDIPGEKKGVQFSVGTKTGYMEYEDNNADD